MKPIATVVDPCYKDCGFSGDLTAACARTLVLNAMVTMNALQPDPSSEPIPGTSQSSGIPAMLCA